MTQDLLPDQVWAQLRPQDAQLTRLSHRQVLAVAMTLVLLVSATVLAHLSGLIDPRVSAARSMMGGTEGSGAFIQEVDLENDGWFDVRIERVDALGTGLRAVSTGAGQVIPAGRTATIRLDYQVVDCARVGQQDSAPILLHLRGPWGEYARTVQIDNHSRGIAWQACPH